MQQRVRNPGASDPPGLSPDNSLEEMVAAIAGTERAFIEKNGLDEVLPKLVVDDGSGKLGIMLLQMPPTPKDRDRLAMILKVSLAARRVKRYVFVSEVWAAEPAPGETMEQFNARPPSERENKREVLMLIAVDGTQAIGQAYPIHRSETRRWLGPADKSAHAIDGRFANLLPGQGPNRSGLPEAPVMSEEMIQRIETKIAGLLGAAVIDPTVPGGPLEGFGKTRH